MGVTDPHPVQEQTAYLLGHVVPSHRVVVAHDDSGIVGFLASTDDSVGQLYVRVDRIGRGTRGDAGIPASCASMS